MDAYYTAVDYYIHLSSRPIPYYDNKSEWQIYKKLFLSSPIPRTLLFEASVNPLPLLGVYLKKQTPAFYDGAQVSDHQNVIQSITTGFEEPAALSVFLGNIIDFKPKKRRSYAEGRGYMGTLVSVGNNHIKDNELVRDNWVEAEWKVKGDKKLADVKLHWSFRVGGKFHGNADIADVFYVGLRRARTDYGEKAFSFLKNSGIMYKYDFDVRNFNAVQHHFVVDKKFPMGKSRVVPTLAVGFVLRTKDKYKGSLKTEDEARFQFLFQPNVEF